MFAAESCPRQAWAWHPFFLNYARYIPPFLRHYAAGQRLREKGTGTVAAAFPVMLNRFVPRSQSPFPADRALRNYAACCTSLRARPTAELALSL